jgi:hypothetical protein
MKSLWTKIKLFFGIIGIYLYLRLSLYGAWSWTYRTLFEWKYRNIKLSTFDRYEGLLAVTRKLIWTADTWRQLGDAISRPERVEYVARWSINKRVGDCDEFAIYNVATLNKSLRERVFVGDLDLEAAYLLTVTWMKKDGGYGGHNVALLVKSDQGYQYMDYGIPSKTRNSVREIAMDVVNRYASGGTLLLYGIQTENLRCFQVGR